MVYKLPVKKIQILIQVYINTICMNDGLFFQLRIYTIQKLLKLKKVLSAFFLLSSSLQYSLKKMISQRFWGVNSGPSFLQSAVDTITIKSAIHEDIKVVRD